MRRILLTIFPLLLIPFYIRANESGVLTKDTPYSDDVTCLVFPAQIGNFTKYMVRKNQNRYIGVTICYGTPHPGCLADIFIYALKSGEEVITPAEFKVHTDQLCKNMVNSLAGSTNEQMEKQLYKDGNTVLAELYFFSIEINGDRFRSGMLILPRGTQIIKARVTVPAELSDGNAQCMRFCKELCKLIFENNQAGFVSAASREKTKSATGDLNHE